MNREKGQVARELQTKAMPKARAREPEFRTAPVYHPAVQDSRMTFDLFVETKFVPEHVKYKTLAGQTHYHAMLKHLLKPERVNEIFNPRNAASARLTSVAHWPYLDGVRLCDIKADHVRRIIAASQSAGYSSQTVKHIRNAFFAIISHAQNEGCFNGVNPAALVKLPRIVRTARGHLTFQQSMALLKELRSPEKEAALFTVTTGMTLVELCHLRWQHVNLSECEKDLSGEIIPAWSIGVRTSWDRGGIADGRTGTRNRNIEICAPLLSFLKHLKGQSSNVAEDGFVLGSQTGSPISPSCIRLAQLKQAGRALGIPWVNWQILRRVHLLLPPTFRLAMEAPVISVREPWKEPLKQPISLGVLTPTGTTTEDSRACGAFCFGNRFRTR